jgi:hypothetical protein
MLPIHFSMQPRNLLLFTIVVALIFTGCAKGSYKSHLTGKDPEVIMEKVKLTDKEAIRHICDIVMEQSRSIIGEEGSSDIWGRSEFKNCDSKGFTVVDRGAINPHKKGSIQISLSDPKWEFFNKYYRFNGQPSFTVTREANFSNITRIKIWEFDGKPVSIYAFTNTDEEVFKASMSNKTLAALEIICPNLAGK